MKTEGMKTRRLGALLMLFSLLVTGSAQTNQPGRNTQSINVSRSGSRLSQPGPAENFTRSVRVEPLIQPIAPSRMAGGSVTFEPGARTAWHTHHPPKQLSPPGRSGFGKYKVCSRSITANAVRCAAGFCQRGQVESEAGEVHLRAITARQIAFRLPIFIFPFQ